MTLDELDSELRAKVVVIDRTPPPTAPLMKTVVEIADEILRGRSRSYVEPQHGLMIVREQEDTPVSVVLVEDEDGCVQYMRRSPDGHLGALDA